MGSEGRLEAGGAFDVVIIYGTETINLRKNCIINMALKIRLCSECESLGSEGRLATGGAFVVVMLYN